MKQHVRLNLNNITTTTPLPILLSLLQCENIQNCNITFSSFIFNSSLFGAIRVDDAWYSKSDIKRISKDETYIEFDCYIDFEFEDIVSLMNQNILEFDVSGYTSIFLFKQQSENDVLNKDIYLWDILSGKFNHAINLKNVNIDVKEYDGISNYAWIPSLKRYYYVDSVELISADFSRLHLREDVLMTWKNLIKQQRAFITRYENSTLDELVDNRKPLEDKLSIEYIPLTSTSSGVSMIRINTDANSNEERIMVTILNDESTLALSPLDKPTNLPYISYVKNANITTYFLTPSEFSSLCKALYKNDTYGSYIISAIWLPFKPDYIYFQPTDAEMKVRVKDKYLTSMGNFKSNDSELISLETWVYAHSSEYDISPYLVVESFTNTFGTKFYEREPYAQYDLFISFVGWVKLPSVQISGHHILVYYSLENTTGMATAYVYDATDSKLIYSSTCQMGVKIDLSTTNMYENIKQKQSNDLNMLMGALSSALSIGIGAVTENPLAIVGGVMSGAKTIASYVNTNRTIFDRASVSFGSNAGSLYTAQDVVLRKVYNKPLTINDVTFKHLQGLPYNNYVYNMVDLTGYVEIGEIHFNPNGESIYQDEIQEIVSLLQNGVIF